MELSYYLALFKTLDLAACNRSGIGNIDWLHSQPLPDPPLSIHYKGIDHAGSRGSGSKPVHPK